MFMLPVIPSPLAPAQQWGGRGGESWSFNEERLGKVTQIVISVGDVVDSITVEREYNGIKERNKFGGEGGSDVYQIDLCPDEYITSINGYFGGYYGVTVIYSLSFVTNQNLHGPYGAQKGEHFSTDSGVIVGFHGRGGSFLDAIGVYFNLPTPIPPNEDDDDDDQCEPRDPGAWGGRGGKPWDDGVFSTIKEINIATAGNAIRSVQVLYRTKNGELVWSRRHGKPGGDATQHIILDTQTEFLVKVSGFHGSVEGNGLSDAVRSLSFYTNKGKRYGPYGDQTGTYFSSPRGKLVGLHGRSGVFLDAIGVHMDYF